MLLERRPNMESPRTGAGSPELGEETGGCTCRATVGGADGSRGCAGGASLGGNSTVAALAEIVGGAGSGATIGFEGGGAGGAAVAIDGPTGGRLRIGAVRGGGG